MDQAAPQAAPRRARRFEKVGVYGGGKRKRLWGINKIYLDYTSGKGIPVLYTRKR